jgi:hypothetical protein
MWKILWERNIFAEKTIGSNFILGGNMKEKSPFDSFFVPIVAFFISGIFCGQVEGGGSENFSRERFQPSSQTGWVALGLGGER